MAPSPIEVRVPLADGHSLQAELTLPDGSGPHPGVVVLHEAFGLTGDIRRICGRFAGAGYATLAPSLYSHGGRLQCLTRVMLDGLTTPRRGTLDDIEATRKVLAERPEVDGHRVGVIGFCQGGGFALAFAARSDVRAAAVNYGRVPKERRQVEGVCPVVASYGAEDGFLRRDPDRLERYLTELGVPHDVKVYDGVGHSFMNEALPAFMSRLPPMKAGYSEPQAEDAWRRILAFFAEHVRGPSGP
jgi:carboxymethylenebutenolidase